MLTVDLSARTKRRCSIVFEEEEGRGAMDGDELMLATALTGATGGVELFVDDETTLLLLL